LSPNDFYRIVEQGLADLEPLLPRVDTTVSTPGLHEDKHTFIFEHERERVSSLTSRIVRDRVFRRIILRAYDDRCAITSIKLINGGGRAEATAAHIRPVEANGPDIASNGIALSGTAHWMFDRGLISLADDLQILVSRQVNDPEGVRALINKSGRALMPRRPSDRPHPHFLNWHREHCFKN
jgi:putative restriction endonuclease